MQRLLQIQDSNNAELFEGAILESDSDPSLLFGNSNFGKLISNCKASKIKVVIDNNYPYTKLSYKIFLYPNTIEHTDLSIDNQGDKFIENESFLFLRYRNCFET